jgi:alpha-ketoglutarate-dependent taurine dioxygenase
VHQASEIRTSEGQNRKHRWQPYEWWEDNERKSHSQSVHKHPLIRVPSNCKDVIIMLREELTWYLITLPAHQSSKKPNSFLPCTKITSTILPA